MLNATKIKNENVMSPASTKNRTKTVTKPSSARPKAPLKPKRVGKKKLVQQDLFEMCKRSGNFTFDNKQVERAAKRNAFSNKYDVTKVDHISKLADDIVKAGFCIAHLGKGKHKFIKELGAWFHEFEEIETETIVWPYRKSVLNETDTSESNILSIGFNQRIIHDFLHEDIVSSPKMYGSRRTKFTADYLVGNEKLKVTKVQMEIDLTTEHLGAVTVFEGKNDFPKDFAVYQIFHPFLYFHQMKLAGKIDVKEINCCYLTRKRIAGFSVIRLHLYGFKDPNRLDSLFLKKCAEYKLVPR